MGSDILFSTPNICSFIVKTMFHTHIYKTGKIIIIWFMVYSSPSRQMQRYYLKSGHYSFRAYPFHLSIHWFYHLMLYKPWINNIIVTFLHCWYKCQFYRLKFSPGGSPLDWFISSDMFYLEVMLESTGGVKDVRIHHEGKVEQQVSMFSIRFEVITVLSITIRVLECG